MKRHYSVIVVGAGSMGMAAGYYLGKKGIDTLLIDAQNPPHSVGSHHGETRLIRHTPGEGEHYVPLVLRAQELWYELEEEFNKKLFYPTGTLMVGENNASFINDTLKIANKYSLPMERLNSHEIQKRWPEFSVPDYYTGYFESTSGALLGEECIKAYKQLSDNYQTTLQTNTVVHSIASINSVVKVQTNKNTYYADKVIVSAGAWTGKICKELGLPLHPIRKTFGWFETNDPSFQHPMLPSFYFNFDNQRYYGFPDITESGIKIGRNDSERDIDPDFMSEDFGKYENDAGDLEYFVEKFIPRAASKFKKGQSCMITNTPDKNFIIDTHPEQKNIIIVGGFSGHGFKYSSVIGEILSQIIADGKTSHDISKFSISRKALTSSFN